MTWLRWAPDVLLLVGAWKLRYRPRAVVAWSMLGLGVAWLVWAGLSMAAPTATGRIVSLLPILVALLMTLALEFKHAPEPVPAVIEDHQPVNEPVEASPAATPPAPRKGPVKARGCPTRDAGRQILLDLDLAGKLAETSNAELSRLHGGSDVWWGRQRTAYQTSLENLGAEASTL